MSYFKVSEELQICSKTNKKRKKEINKLKTNEIRKLKEIEISDENKEISQFQIAIILHFQLFLIRYYTSL